MDWIFQPACGWTQATVYVKVHISRNVVHVMFGICIVTKTQILNMITAQRDGLTKRNPWHLFVVLFCLFADFCFVLFVYYFLCLFV